MRKVMIVALVAVVAVAGCSRKLNMDGAKSSISAGVTEKVGLPITGVTCPEEREAKAGDTFDCTVTAEGGATFTVKVTQSDEKGNVNWEVADTKGLLDLGAVERSVIGGLKEQLSIDATVSCGGKKYRSAEPGKSFDCTARTADQEIPIRVNMKDLDGNIAWETVAK